MFCELFLYLITDQLVWFYYVVTENINAYIILEHCAADFIRIIQVLQKKYFVFINIRHGVGILTKDSF